MDRITGFAKADTAFGPMAGRTAVEIHDQGNNSVVITFRCGPTPVMLSLAGQHYHDFVRAVIAKASPHSQELLNKRLEHLAS